jgi:hypothetical protein
MVEALTAKQQDAAFTEQAPQARDGLLRDAFAMPEVQAADLGTQAPGQWLGLYASNFLGLGSG